MAGLLTASCNGLVDPSKNETETFSGVISPQGFASHAFSVTRNGEISVKIIAQGPVENIPLGVIWAQASSSGCNGAVLQSGYGYPGSGSIVVGQIFQGNYCVLVYDLGILQANETYTVTVSHP